MAVVFGSGAVLDEHGLITRNGSAAVSAAPAGAESPEPPAPVQESADGTPGEGGTSPAVPEAPTDPAPVSPPVEPTEPEEDGEEALVLPPTTKSQRQFVRRLLKQVAQYEQRVPSLEQQVATLTTLLQQQQQAQNTRQPTVPEPTPSPAPGMPAVPAGPPRPDTFATHEEYVQALVQWGAQQAVQAALAQRDAADQQRQAAQAKAQQDAQQEQRLRTWYAKMGEGRQQFADFDLVVGNPALSLAPQVIGPVVETVLESPHGPAILHYLGAHPDVTVYVNGLSAWAAARVLGEIESLVRPAPKAPAPAPAPPPQAAPAPAPPPAPVVLTPPPAPLTPVGGGQAPASPMTFRQGMGLDAYRRMREQETTRRV